jgi:hypothetical protein
MRCTIRALGILTVCLAVVACGSKASRANFDQVKLGMSQSEVEKLLGTGEQADRSELPPGTQTTATKFLKWKGEGLILVGFDNDGKVAYKSMTTSK